MVIKKSESNIIDPKKQWAIVILAILVTAIILFIGDQSFKATEKTLLDEFNQRQLTLAQTAAAGIKGYFEFISIGMKSLTSLQGIQYFDEKISRRETKYRFDELEPMGIMDIGIINADGILKYSVTNSFIEGTDFSWRNYFQSAKKMTPQNSQYITEFIEFKGIYSGQKGIIIAIPMFEKKGKFAGVVICILKLKMLAQKFIAPIKSINGGYTFLIDGEYNILWSPYKFQIGQNIIKKTVDFPEFQQILKNMKDGSPGGTGRYFYYKFDNSTGKYMDIQEEKLIAYSNIPIGKDVWSLAVWAPKEEVRKTWRETYHKQQLLILATILTIILGSCFSLFISFKIKGMLENEVKIKTSDLKKSQGKLDRIKNIGAMANASLDLDEVLHNILKGTLVISGASVGMIFLKDAKTGSLSWGASIGLSDAFVNDYKNRHIQLGEGLTGRIAQNGELIYIPEDSSHDPRIARPVIVAENLNTFIGVPIYAAGEIVGVMNILSRPPHILDKENVALISAIGIHIGSAIQNAHLFQENVRAKELLEKSEKKYRDLYDNAPDIYYSLDKDGIIVDCNETGSKMLGYKKDEIIGKPLTDFLTKKSKQLFAETFPTLHEKRILLNLEREFIRKDGTVLPASLNIYTEIDEGGVLLKTKTIARDITVSKQLENELKKRIREIEELFIELITAMVNALDAKSSWTKGHSESVVKYAEELAKELGLGENDTKKLKLAGLLHDIGKIGIPDSLLDKEGKLTNEELEIVKKHSLKAMKILEGIKQLEDIIPLIKHHHERIDGKGYPDGLKDDNIPLGAKIIHLLDSFDAMTSDRPYRKNPGIEYAVSELKKHSGTQFDQKIVDSFLKILTKIKKLR